MKGLIMDYNYQPERRPSWFDRHPSISGGLTGVALAVLLFLFI
jgi:hypothetical protein